MILWPEPLVNMATRLRVGGSAEGQAARSNEEATTTAAEGRKRVLVQGKRQLAGHRLSFPPPYPFHPLHPPSASGLSISPSSLSFYCAWSCAAAAGECVAVASRVTDQ